MTPGQVSRWILTSCQPHKGYLRTVKLCHKQMHILKLFSHVHPFLKSNLQTQSTHKYKTNHKTLLTCTPFPKSNLQTQSTHKYKTNHTYTNILKSRSNVKKSKQGLDMLVLSSSLSNLLILDNEKNEKRNGQKFLHFKVPSTTLA